MIPHPWPWPAAVTAVIDAAAVAAYPREACGLVVDTPAGPAARPGRNLDDSATAFTLDPAVLLRARRAGEPIVGLYHSHCDAAAVPSAQDQAAARHWPDVVHAIVRVDRGVVVDRRAFLVTCVREAAPLTTPR